MSANLFKSLLDQNNWPGSKDTNQGQNGALLEQVQIPWWERPFPHPHSGPIEERLERPRRRNDEFRDRGCLQDEPCRQGRGDNREERMERDRWREQRQR